MEGFFGPRLLHAGKEVATGTLTGRVVGVYFSAHWCPPCREFTPLLSKVYRRAKEKGKSLDIVFLSGDRDEASFNEYFASMPWHAVPFSNPVPKQVLSQTFRVKGIPALVLLDGSGGILDVDAKSKVMMPRFPSTLPREIDVRDNGPGPGDSVEVVVRCRGEEHVVQCEPEEGWELFRMQIFSVTEIAAEKQRLFGLGVPNGPLDETVPLPRALAGAFAALRGRPLGVADTACCASSSYGDASPGAELHRGSLDSPQAWGAKKDDKTPWYQMALGEVKQVAGILLAPRADCAQWVTKFRVSISMSTDGPWNLVDGGCEFDGCKSMVQDPIRTLFAAPVSASFVRIEPTAHHGHCCLRADVLEHEEGPPDRLPEVVVLGNFSADDPFEVEQPDQQAGNKLIEEQHLAMLQARLSNAPGKLQAEVRHVEHVRGYEERALQRQALDDIPVCAFDALVRSSKKDECYEVAFMRQLLRWFKHDFFKWTNAPSCEHCGSGDTKTIGQAAPSPMDKQYGAGTVEVAQCAACGMQTRFPRYNDPSKLLETRNGRCGEWANCFTLVCRALGYEARHIHDWTDHVWTEVYSDGLQRWLHADSCEAALDSPLMYEQGWGKKLTYCFAFARDHAVDVTKRYTRKFDELLTRRNDFTEQQLQQAMRAINEFAIDRSVATLAEADGEARRTVLQRRAELEAKELDGGGPNAAKPEEQVGRTSGEAAWREQRGELGANNEAKRQALQLSEKGVADAAASAAGADSAPVQAAPSEVKPVVAQAAAAAAPQQRPSSAGTQALIKAKFAEYVASGLAPNDAAVRALEDVKGSRAAAAP